MECEMSKMLQGFGADIVYFEGGPASVFGTIYLIEKNGRGCCLKHGGNDVGNRHVENESRNFGVIGEIPNLVHMIEDLGRRPLLGHGIIKESFSGIPIVREISVCESYDFSFGYEKMSGSLGKREITLSAIGYELTGKAQGDAEGILGDLHSERIAGLGLLMPGNLISPGPNEVQLTDFGYAVHVPKRLWRKISDSEFQGLKERDKRDLDKILEANLR